jgi:hypothetical protein
MALDERHQSHLLSTFAEVDDLVTEAVRCIDAAALRSPFAKRLDDVRPIQRQLIAQDVERMRATMRALLERHRIVEPPPAASAAAACRVAIERALIAAEALEPRQLRRDGPLSADDEAELNRIVSQLMDRLLHMEDHLAAFPAGNLSARVARLDGTAADARLLRTLAETIDARHLTHLRPTLEALLDRVEANDFQVAVFGRTNAGKSSLLNALLDGAFLPVGALPATAVPIHVAYGPLPRGLAQFADAIPDAFDPGRLAEFAAEQYNPANGRHVLRLRLEVPALRLAEGITLIDMPGMALGAPPEHLPCCDIGIVAIDATGDLTLGETAVIEALRRNGTTVIVLITKADLLAFDDRWRVFGFVSRELAARTGADLPIYLASTTATDPALRGEWIENGFEPCLRQREQLRAVSLRTKLAMLEGAVDEATASPPLAGLGDCAAACSQAQDLLVAAQASPLMPEAVAARQADALVDEVAGNAAVLWRKLGDEATMDITTLVSASLEARSGGVAKEVSRELLKLRAHCAIALAATGQAGAFDLPRPHDMPVFRDRVHPTSAVLHMPWFAFLGHWWIRRCWRQVLLRSGLGALVAGAMKAYFEQVEAWRARMLMELWRSFETDETESPSCWKTTARQ